LRSFQQKLGDFDSHGIRLVAVSVDEEEASRQHRQKMGFSFPLLSDQKAEVIRRYDVFHPGGGPKGADIARPAEFLINSDGIIQWVNLTESVIVRARPEQVLKAFDGQGGKIPR
jgi:peroxiredoxin